jgi:hypothetical protein
MAPTKKIMLIDPTNTLVKYLFNTDKKGISFVLPNNTLIQDCRFINKDPIEQDCVGATHFVVFSPTKQYALWVKKHFTSLFGPAKFLLLRNTLGQQRTVEAINRFI